MTPSYAPTIPTEPTTTSPTPTTQVSNNNDRVFIMFFVTVLALVIVFAMYMRRP